MMLCIYGFPTNVSALKFEWAWQHPIESLAVREAALSFKSLSGIANRVKLAFTMLTLPPWQSLKLTVNFFSTMYTKHAAGCPSLPKQMKIQVCSMDELPCYIGDSQESDEVDDEEEREHEDGGNGVGEISQSERSEDISVENSVAYPNTDHDWERLIEDDGFQQQMDSHSPREEDKERPSCENGENGMGEMNQSEIFNDILENAAAYPSFYHDWESMIEYDGLQQHGGAYCPTRSRDVDSSPEALSTRMARIVNKRQRVKESILSGSFANTGANKLGHLTKKMLAKIGHNNLWQPTMEMLTTTPDVGGFQSPPSGSFLHPVPFRQQKEFLTSIDKEASLSSFITDSPLQMPSSIISTFVDTTQAVENRNSVELIEETGGKFGRTRLPAFVVDSPVHPPSSSISRSVDAVQKLEDRDSFELIEETGSELWLASMQQMATMTASSENHSPSKTRLPSFVIDSPVHPPSSSISRFFDTVQEVEDRETFELIEETGSELGRASKQQTTTMTVSGEDHSPSKTSPLCPPEVCFRQPRDKRGRPPFCVLDSPMEKPSSSVIEFPCGLTPKGCANKMNEANKQQLRVPGNNNYDQQASSSSAFRPSPEVEVINLLTPSPDCTNDSFHSKKRRTLVHRDLIDLTRSPMFVQL